jgi:hypothetical protein
MVIKHFCARRVPKKAVIQYNENLTIFKQMEYNMLFYVFSLIVGIFGTAVIACLFGRSLDRNHNRRNRRPISYLMPVFLSLLLILFSARFTAPRLFDLVTLISGKYQVNDVLLTEKQIHWGSLEIDGQPYYYNRFQYKPQPEIRYRLTTLPNSHHVILLEQIAVNISIGGPHGSGS